MADTDTQIDVPQQSSQSSAWDDYVKQNPEWQLPAVQAPAADADTEIQATPDTAGVTALKSTAEGVVPAGGAAAGALVGGEIGAFGGPADIVTVPVGAFVGAIAGSIGASKAQKAVLDKVAPSVEEQEAVNEQAHPIASAIGDIASSLPAFEFAPGTTVKGVATLVKMARGVPIGETAAEIKAAKDSVIALAAQSGLGAAGSVIAPMVQGQSPDLKDVGISTLTALLMGKPRDYIENAFGKLGLPKPPVASTEQAAGETQPEKPLTSETQGIPQNVLESPGTAYSVPQEIQDKLTPIAQKESATGLLSLTPEELAAKEAATNPANANSPDYHKDALGFYTQQMALADKEKASQYATAEAMPHAMDIVGHEAENEPETKPAEEPVKPSEPTPPLETKPETKPEPILAGKDFLNMPRPHEDGVEEGMKLTSSDVPHIQDLLKESVSQMSSDSIKTMPDDSYKILMAKNSYLSGVIEGAQRKGPNYDFVMLRKAQMAEAARKASEATAWQNPALKPEENELSEMTEGNEAQVKRQEVEGNAQGKKRAQTFEDTADPNVIYTDSRAGKNRNETRKLVAMTDGKTVFTGSAYENNGTRYVTHFDSKGDPVARKFDDLVKEGWKPLAAIKTNEATKGYVKTYSPDEWAKVSGELRDRVKADQRTAAAMEEHLGAGKEFGLTEQEKESNAVHDEGQTVIKSGYVADDEPSHFTPEHAEAIFDSIHGAKNLEEVAKIIQKVIPKNENTNTSTNRRPTDGAIQTRNRRGYSENGEDLHPTTISGKMDRGAKADSRSPAKESSEIELKLAIQSLLLDSRLIAPDMTKDDAAQVLRKLYKTIYDSYTASGKNAEKFSDRLTKAVLDESGKSTAGQRPGLLQSGVNKVAGTAAPEGDESAAARSAGGATTEAGAAGDTGKPAGGTAANGTPSERPAGTAGTGTEAELKIRNREAQAYSKKFITSPAKAAQLARQVVHALQQLGVDVRLMQEAGKELSKDSGKMEAWKNDKGQTKYAITVNMADMHNPSQEFVITLLHEAGHVLLEDDTPIRQAQLHTSIEGASDEVLGLHNFFEHTTGRFMSEVERNKVVQGGRLVESIAQRLHAQGWTPEESSSIAQRVILAVRNLYQRAAMAVMQAMGLPVSPERALAYFETRMKLALSGGKADSLVSFLGGPRIKFPDWDHPSSVSSAEAFLTRNRDQAGTSAFNPMTTQAGSGDIKNPTEEKIPSVVAEGIVHNTMASVVKAFDEEGGNPAGISGEDLFKKFLPDDALPANNVALINENLVRNGHQPVKPNIGINDIPSKAMRDEAAARALGDLQTKLDTLNGKRPEAETKLKSAEAQLVKNAKSSTDAIEKYTDLKLISDQAAVRMQEAIKEATDNQNQANVLNMKDSLLEQNLRELDDQLKGSSLLPKPWKDALDKIAKRLGVGSDVPLQDMLQRLGDKQLDWNLPARELGSMIRNMIDDPELAALRGTDRDSRALLATAITFAKKNDFLMNLLTLRKAGMTTERMAVNEALKTALENHSNAINEARLGAKKVGKLAPLLDKLLNNISQLKKESHELTDEAARQRQFIHFHTLAAPILEHAMRPLEAQIGAIRTNVNISPMTEVTTPQTATSRPDQFVKKTLQMSDSKTGKATLTPEIREDIQKRQAWLDANRANRDKLGAVYNYQEALNRELSQYLRVFGMATPIKDFWLAKWIAPTAERLRLIGTPTARAAALMIERANAIANGLRTPATLKSHQWEIAREDAMKALGITSRVNFKNNIDDPFKDFSSKNKDARAKFSKQEDATNAAVKAGVDNLRKNPEYAKLLADPKRAKAVEDFFRKNVEMNEWMAENGRNMGNKIYDRKLGLFRNTIGSAEAEYARSVSTQAEALFKSMGAWNDTMKPADIEAMHAQRDPKLAEVLNPRFTPDVWQKFVQWIVNKDGTSAFSSPQRSDGKTDYARRDNVIKSYVNATGETGAERAISFAHNLFRLEIEESPDKYAGADLNKFVADTMHSFQAQYEILKSMNGDVSEAQVRGLPTMGRHLQDARLTDAAPRQFYDYVDYDRSNVPRLTRTQAYNAAYGRGMENWYQTTSAAIQEQRDLVNKYDAISQQIAEKSDLTGKPLRKATLAAAKNMTEDGRTIAEGGKPLNVEALAEAHQRLRNLTSAVENQNAYFKNNSGRPPELSVLATLMHGIGSLTVSGPGTAIIAHTIAFEQMIRNFGLSADGLDMLLRTGKGVFPVTLRMAMQSFGRAMVNDADHLSNLQRVGNPRWTNTIRQDIRSIMIQPEYVHNVAGRALVYAGRAMQTLAQRVSAFHLAARVCQLASSKAWADKIEGAIQHGIDHFEAHPADRENPDFQFTAKQLGLKSEDDTGRSFKYFNYAISKYGLDMRQMVEDAMNRRAGGKDEPLLTDDIYRKIAQVSLDDNTQESSPTTRPSWLTNNTLGQLLNPMFGWTVNKSWAVARATRDPDGVKSLNAFKTASLAYVGILPLAMVAAYLRNKFDEDVQGKKQNVSDLSTIQNPQQAFLTAVDNAARVGTFGIAGEVMNMGLNKDNSRPLSLDGRLFVMSTIENTFGAIENLAQQRDFDYQTVVRPLIQSLGGNGFYQYAGIVNHTFGLDNTESRVMNRISVNNYLRVAGRQTGMDVRTYSGMMQTASQPNPWRAPVGNMVMAAYANDAQGFMDAKNEAIQKLTAAGYKPDEAKAKVLQEYEDSNPLQIVFKSKPSQAEYQKMLASMDDNGRVSTATAVRLYQHYGDQLAGALGIQNKRGDEKAFGNVFGRGATQADRIATTSGTGTGDSTLDSMLARFRPQPISLDDLRRRASIGY